jgi:hypothetical protein
LLREIDSAELCEWRAYYQLEPFGEQLADQRHGIATSVLANVNRDSKRCPQPYQATDFIYWHESHQAQATGQVQPTANLDPEALSRLIKQRIFKSST